VAVAVAVALALAVPLVPLAVPLAVLFVASSSVGSSSVGSSSSGSSFVGATEGRSVAAFKQGRQRPHSPALQVVAKLVSQSPDPSTDKHDEYDAQPSH
jgi:hypothetical protein